MIVDLCFIFFVIGGKEVLTVNVNQINADLIRQVSSVLSHHDIHGISSSTNHQQQQYPPSISQSHPSTSISIPAPPNVSITGLGSSSNYGQPIASGGGATGSSSVAPLLLINPSASSNQAPFSLPSNTSRR